jgi:glycerol-3-phosphate acyltransferase PlsX
LLNIGTEPGKGTAELNQAANLFRNDSNIHFVGFIEPSDLFAGSADVIVCDGYAGNLVLKTVESMASFLRSQLKLLEANTDQLQSLAAKVDIDRYNGALLAGLAGVVIKSHGSASERGFLHAILQGRDSVRGQLLHACTQALTTGQVKSD